MTLQELINWAHNQGIEDFDKVNLEFNIGEDFHECYIPIEEFALGLDKTTNPATKQVEHTIYIDKY